MSVTVKKAILWRVETTHEPGALSRVLEPLAAAGADLRVVMGYSLGVEGRAAIEVFPITGKKATAAARSAGLVPSSIACLLVEGDNRAGLGSAMTQAIAAAGINISFLVAEVVGRKFSAVFGFANDAVAAQAQKLIKSAAGKTKRR